MPDARLKKRTGRQSMIAMARVNPSGRGCEEGKRFLNVFFLGHGISTSLRHKLN